MTEGALHAAGYLQCVPATVYTTVAEAPKLVRLAALGAFIAFVFAKEEVEMPKPVRALTTTWQALHRGTLEIPGLTKSVVRAPGGFTYSETSPTVTGAYPRIFSPESLKGM